jgi:hypothetical protein
MEKELKSMAGVDNKSQSGVRI